MTHDLSVHVERVFRATPAELFQAWSDPAFIERWWENLSVAQLDFREGGAYRFEWKSWDGHVEGEYLALITNEQIRFSWSGVPAGGEKEEVSEVEIVIEPVEEGLTRMRLTHSLDATLSAHKSHREGWTAALRDLAEEFARVNGPVNVEREIAAPPAEVYAWLTEPSRMEQWFFTACEANATRDGEYKIQWRSEEEPARDHERHGRYLEVIPNERIVFEWLGFTSEDLQDQTTTVRIELAPSAKGTHLRLSHSGWGENAAWTAARDGHESGWHFFMDQLKRTIEGGADLRSDLFGQKVK